MQAGGDITANRLDLGTSKTTPGTGTIIAGGSFTLKCGGVSSVGGNGTIIAKTGDITIGTEENGFADITIADSEDASLTLSAENGTITADGITATNVYAKHLVANDVAIENGTLVLGSATEDASTVGNLSLTGSTAGIKGTLKVDGGRLNNSNMLVSGDLELSGTMNLVESSVSNVTFEQGTTSADKGLFSIDKDGNVSLNGGMETGEGATASVDFVTIKDGKVTLQGITADKNTLAFTSTPYKNVGIVTFGLGTNVDSAVDVTVADSNFTNNTVNVDINDRNQTTAGGAAISFDANDSTEQSQLTISKSIFDGNTFNTTFEDGTATGGGSYGGAIGVQDSVAVRLDDVVLKNNTAKSDLGGAQGGGYFQSAYGDKEATLAANHLKVTGNTAEGKSAHGGGMALFGVEATITDATFSDNTANGTEKSMGGALFISENGGQPSTGTITNGIFTNNKAKGANGWGGAIYNGGTLTVNGGEFTGNEAGKYGGAIAGDVDGKGSLTVNGATFTKNTSGSGGAIALWSHGTEDAASHSISGLFEGNVADRKGGAIAFLTNHSGDETVTASISGEFLNNSAGESGGAIHSERATLTIADAVFSGNSAEKKGGAIYNDANSSITFKGDNLFTGNTAAEGKDIYNEGDITFDGTNTQMDGGMVMAKGTMAVNNSQVSMAELTAKGGEITVTGSELSVSKLTENTLGSTLTVGTDGIVNIGNLDTTKLGEAMNDASMGSGSAVLALNTSVTLADGARLVVGNDGSKGAAAASFGDNSLLVVDAEGVTGNQVIHADGSGNKTAFIHSGAQLRIINAVAGESVTVLNGFDTIKNEDGTLDAKWVNNEGVENLDYMLSSYAQIVNDNGQYDVIVVSELNDPTEALPGIDPDLAPVLNEVWANKLNDVDSPDMGVRFLSRAARADYVNGDAAKSAATIESAARIAFAGAVPQMTKMASDAATNAVVNRLGFANPADGAQAMNAEGQIVDRNTTGFALWIAPLWQSQHGWGMEAGNLDYGFNGNLGGVSLGADYTFENAIRAGITFNIGGGYAETSGGDLNSTQNNMNFWGLGAYAGWNYENFAVMADVSYTSTWNQLEQDLDPGMGMGDLEADVQATAISAGLRAEYKLETSVLDIIPHVGVRYMSLNTWGYDVDARGGTVMEGDGFHQDIWTFPVGVTFSKDFTLDSGWFFKPSLDFSVIPAAGDIKAKEDVRFTGAPAVAEMETQMMDYLTWQGGVGLEMGNDTMSFGVNYTLQAGQHTTGHGVFGSFRYEF